MRPIRSSYSGRTRLALSLLPLVLGGPPQRAITWRINSASLHVRPTQLAADIAPWSRGDATDMLLQRTTPDTTTPGTERLVAEGSILTHGNDDEHIFLPATIHGQQVTLVADLGTTGDGLMDGDWFAKLGGAKIGGARVGSDVQSSIAIPGAGFGFINVTFGSVTNQTIQVLFVPFKKQVPGLPPLVGLLGNGVLNNYDLLLDGPAHRFRMYTPPSQPSGTSAGHQTARLPAGVTPADCLPLRRRDDTGLITLDLTVNAHPVSGVFDSGAKDTYLDPQVAKQLGVIEAAPHVHVTSAAIQTYYGKASPQKYLVWDGVDVMVGPLHLSSQSIVVKSTGTDAMMNLGLDAFRDRVLWISNSTKQICISQR